VVKNFIMLLLIQTVF